MLKNVNLRTVFRSSVIVTQRHKYFIHLYCASYVELRNSIFPQKIPQDLLSWDARERSGDQQENKKTKKLRRPHHGSSSPSKTTAEAAAQQRPNAAVDSNIGGIDIYIVS
jgi:hypothetical protein